MKRNNHWEYRKGDFNGPVRDGHVGSLVFNGWYVAMVEGDFGTGVPEGNINAFMHKVAAALNREFPSGKELRSHKKRGSR